MNEQRIKFAQQTLVEMLDDAAVARGGDSTLESLRDAVAQYSIHHPLFRKLAFKGFGEVAGIIDGFTPEVSAVPAVDQFVAQL